MDDEISLRHLPQDISNESSFSIQLPSSLNDPDLLEEHSDFIHAADITFGFLAEGTPLAARFPSRRPPSPTRSDDVLLHYHSTGSTAPSSSTALHQSQSYSYPLAPGVDDALGRLGMPTSGGGHVSRGDDVVIEGGGVHYPAPGMVGGSTSSFSSETREEKKKKAKPKSCNKEPQDKKTEPPRTKQSSVRGHSRVRVRIRSEAEASTRPSATSSKMPSGIYIPKTMSKNVDEMTLPSNNQRELEIPPTAEVITGNSTTIVTTLPDATHNGCSNNNNNDINLSGMNNDIPMDMDTSFLFPLPTEGLASRLLMYNTAKPRILNNRARITAGGGGARGAVGGGGGGGSGSVNNDQRGKTVSTTTTRTGKSRDLSELRSDKLPNRGDSRHSHYRGGGGGGNGVGVVGEYGGVDCRDLNLDDDEEEGEDDRKGLLTLSQLSPRKLVPSSSMMMKPTKSSRDMKVGKDVKPECSSLVLRLGAGAPPPLVPSVSMTSSGAAASASSTTTKTTTREHKPKTKPPTHAHAHPPRRRRSSLSTRPNPTTSKLSWIHKSIAKSNANAGVESLSKVVSRSTTTLNVDVDVRPPWVDPISSFPESSAMSTSTFASATATSRRLTTVQTTGRGVFPSTSTSTWNSNSTFLSSLNSTRVGTSTTTRPPWVDPISSFPASSSSSSAMSMSGQPSLINRNGNGKMKEKEKVDKENEHEHGNGNGITRTRGSSSALDGICEDEEGLCKPLKPKPKPRPSSLHTSTKTPTIPHPFTLHTQTRSHLRAEFNERMHVLGEERMREEEERGRVLREEEEREGREVRRRAVPEVHGVPGWYYERGRGRGRGEGEGRRGGRGA